jgi:hypothetical protein
MVLHPGFGGKPNIDAASGIRPPGPKPEALPLRSSQVRKVLKIMVGERGFEPPTPWSRTRFKDLLQRIEIDRK